MKLVGTLALVSLTLLAAARALRAHGLRTAKGTLDKRAEVERWEGEGGGLPTGGQIQQPSKTSDEPLDAVLGDVLG